jgi:hypothetical protein
MFALLKWNSRRPHITEVDRLRLDEIRRNPRCVQGPVSSPRTWSWALKFWKSSSSEEQFLTRERKLGKFGVFVPRNISWVVDS